MKILTVRQPWAWLIVHGFKDIENRGWQTPYRGTILIQASLRDSKTFADDARNVRGHHGIAIPDDLARGGVIGSVTLLDCVRESESAWFSGPVGWVLADARLLPFTPVRGQLHLFDPPAGFRYHATARRR